jgi:serine/threonine protein kinase
VNEPEFEFDLDDIPDPNVPAPTPDEPTGDLIQSSHETELGSSLDSNLGFTFLDLDETDGTVEAPKPEEVDLTAPGTRFGDYEATGMLGEGAMSVVLRGRHVETGTEVAIKILQERMERNQTVRERFRREATAVADLRHENVIRAYLYGIAFNQPFMVLELLEGGSVGDLLSELKEAGERLTVDRAVHIAAHTLAGLEAAHAQGLLHRDIKPDNLLLDPVGRVKIADFGLVKLLGGDDAQQLTRVGARLGTPLYMSPEQAMGDPLNDRTDVYSAGLVLYELLTGEVPLRSRSALDMYEMRVSSPPPQASEVRDDVPPEVDQALALMLQPNPNKRASASEAFRALEACLPSPVERALVRVTDPEGQTFDFEMLVGDRVVLGRSSASSDVQIADRELSRRHCKLTLTPLGLQVEDLGSTNGTFLESHRLVELARAAPGERIFLGDSQIEFALSDVGFD